MATNSSSQGTPASLMPKGQLITGLSTLEKKKAAEAAKAKQMSALELTGLPSNIQPTTAALPQNVVKFTDLETGKVTYPETTITMPKSVLPQSTIAGLPTPGQPITKAPPTVPTPENPLLTTGVKQPSDFGAMSDKDKQVEIGYQIAKSKGLYPDLSDEQLKYLISTQIPDKATVENTFGELGQTVTSQIDQLTQDYEAQKAKLQQQEGATVSAKQKQLDDQYSEQIAQLKQTGQEQQDLVQQRFSFSGFGRSTDSAEQQAKIGEAVQQQEGALLQAKNLEMELFKQQQAGATAEQLAPLSNAIQNAKATAMQFQIDAASKVAELNAQNKVTGMQAIDNLMQALGPEDGGYDENLTKLINDGYLYKTGANGVPEIVTDANGQPVYTGVNDFAQSDLQYIAPQQDFMGNQISPAYAFDKKTGQLMIIGQDGSYEEIEGGEDTMVNFKNFDEYVKSVGNGTVVKGSSYHTGLEVDIDGAIGDIIPSFVTGTVKEVKDSGKTGFGKHIIVEDAEGNQYTYAHLSNVMVNPGDPIYAGQVLGQMGNTGSVVPMGNGDGSHLHIEAKNKAGKKISLADVISESTWQAPQYGGGGANTAQLAAEAFMKGYTTKDQVAMYVNAKQQGVNPPDLKGQELNDKQLSNVLSLKTQVRQDPDIANFIQVRDGYERIKTGGKLGQGPGDLAVIFGYMKMLDPNSVVREGEQASAQSAAGVPQQILSQYNNIVGGGKLSPEARKQFIAAAEALYQQKVSSYQDAFDQYYNIAMNYGIDPTLILRDYTGVQEQVVEASLSKNSSDKEIIDFLKSNGYSAPTQEQIEAVRNQL